MVIIKILERYGSSRKYPQIFAAFAAQVGAMGMGASIYFTATTIPLIQKSGDLGTLSARDESWITSTNFLGAILAGPLAGILVEKFGRRMSILLLTLPCVIGWILMAAAPNVFIMCAGRFISGICSFSLPIIVPLYIAEICEKEIRGILCSIFILMVKLGAQFVYTLGCFTSIPWRMQIAICTLFPIIGHILMMFVPESPNYLIGKGKAYEAKAALKRLRGTNSDEKVHSEYNELVQYFNKRDDGVNSGWNWKYLKELSTLKPTLIGLLVVTSMQTTFHNVIMANAVEVFESTGSTENKYVYTYIIAIIQLVTCIFPIFTVDKVGRRLLFLFSLVGIVVSIGSLGIFFHIKRLNESIAEQYLQSWFPLMCLIIFAIVESMGLSAVVYVIMGEILPPKIKGLSGMLLGVWGRITGFTVLFVFRDLIELLGNDGAYYFIAGLNLIVLILSYFVIPETKGKSLDEINSLFVTDKK